MTTPESGIPARPLGHIRGKQAFSAVRSGPRTRAGAIGIMYRLDAGQMPPRVAFAIGTRVGSAVRRNRLRRQIRAILRTDPDAVLTAGDYLIRVDRAASKASYAELRTALISALGRISDPDRPPSGSRDR